MGRAPSALKAASQPIPLPCGQGRAASASGFRPAVRAFSFPQIARVSRRERTPGLKIGRDEG